MADRLDHNDEQIDLSESVEIAHRNYLSEFMEKVWPIYKEYGFTQDAAIMLWFLNRIDYKLADIRDALQNADNDSGDCPR